MKTLFETRFETSEDTIITFGGDNILDWEILDWELRKAEELGSLEELGLYVGLPNTTAVPKHQVGRIVTRPIKGTKDVRLELLECEEVHVHQLTPPTASIFSAEQQEDFLDFADEMSEMLGAPQSCTVPGS